MKCKGEQGICPQRGEGTEEVVDDILSAPSILIVFRTHFPALKTSYRSDLVLQVGEEKLRRKDIGCMCLKWTLRDRRHRHCMDSAVIHAGSTGDTSISPSGASIDHRQLLRPANHHQLRTTHLPLPSIRRTAAHVLQPICGLC